MGKKQKIIVIIIAVLIAGMIFFLLNSSASRKGKQINIDPENQETLEFLNSGPKSPISGLECENWNRRPIAVMQPSDVQARPAAGFSEADGDGSSWHTLTIGGYRQPTQHDRGR